jgi:peptidylprolyl isomerase
LPRSRKRKTKRGSGSSTAAKRSKGKAQSKKLPKLVAGVIILALAAAGAIFILSGNQDTSRPAAQQTAAQPPPEPAADGTVTLPSGLKYIDLVEGTGATPSINQTAVVHYTGTLEDGTKFDSSVDRGQPFPFRLGSQNIIQGWNEGVATMKVGGKRKLIIPPSLGYGSRGSPPTIPPNATLLFEIELIGIR